MGNDASNNTCTFTPDFQPNGMPFSNSSDSKSIDVFTPHMEYIMSYNRFTHNVDDNKSFDCRSEFVAEQGNRMRNIIRKGGYHDEVRIYDNIADITISTYDLSAGMNFNNDIFIDFPLILPDGAEITMFGNHKIVITQQGSIKGNNILFHSACGEEWKGIEVYGASNQDITTGLHLTGNSIIKNAKTGVSQVYGGGNGYMNLEGTTFQDCERGIELMSSNNDQSIFNSCNFINGKYGITAWQNNFTATSCTFTDIYERGIYGLASSPNVNNDANVVGPHFEDCNIGILLAFPSGQTSASEINDNYFLGNGTGVYIQSGAGVSNSANSTMSSNRFENNLASVKVSGATAYQISNNDFYNSLFGNYIEAGGADPNEIFLNDYNGGITGPLFAVDNSNTNVERNCFDNHSYSDIFVDGVFKDQGTDEVANGNCFSTSNPEVLTNENGPGFTYYQLEEDNPNLEECMLVDSEGNFTLKTSNNSELSDNCGYTTFSGTNVPASGHSSCNPNKNEDDVTQANEDLIALIEEIENNIYLDQETKDNLIEYYERCLRKNKLLLIEILISEGRVDDAVAILLIDERFDMKIKGYSILVDEDRLTDATIYLNNLVPSNREEQDYVFAQNLYLSSLSTTNFTPSVRDLDQLYDNAHENTVLAGFSRSIYLYFTDELIELPTILDGYGNNSPRSSKVLNQQEINIYPNPFFGNEFTISRTNKVEQTYELFSSDGILMSKGVLNLHEQKINIDTDYIGLTILRLIDTEGNVEIHKIVKAN